MCGIQTNALEQLSYTGLDKTGKSVDRLLIGAILGGFYIAIGAWMHVVVSEMVDPFVGSLCFPAGLLFVSLSGSELLTSNMAYGIYPVFINDIRKSIRLHSLSKIIQLLAISLCGNWFACSCVAYFAFTTGICENAMLPLLILKKTSQNASLIFMKAIAANWMVNLAVFQYTCAKEIAHKALLMWIPIVVFVVLGFEHSVANMFFLGVGVFNQNITFALYFHNIVPSLLGNFVGAVSFVFTQCLMHAPTLTKQVV